jgi:hypothetical protein
MFDDYLDGEIPTEASWDLKRHVADCAACQSELEARRTIRQSLSELPVQGPSEGFFDRVFDGLDEQAAQETNRRRSDQPTPWLKGRRLAIAAAFAVVCATAFVVQQPFPGAPSTEIPEVTIAMHEVTSVNLVFSADDALQDARLSLQLPEGVELAGYSGRSALSWKTNLEPGKNVLRLPLVGHLASADEVVATLEHAKGTKTFRLKVKVI